MPKKPKTIDVKGLSVDEIIDMDVNTLGEKDLRAVATRLVSAANKRIRRLQKSEYGTLSPAYERIKHQGRLFSVKGKDISGLRSEMAQMRSFVRLKTSTVKGWNKTRKYVESRMGGTMSPDRTQRFWSIYHRLEEENGGAVGAIYDSQKIQNMLYKEMDDGDEDDILKRMLDKMDREYEKMLIEEDEDNGQDQASGDVFDFKGVF